MKNLFVLVMLFVCSVTFAQKERTLTLNEETNLIDVVYYHDNGVISQTGSYTKDGKLHGDWLSYDEEGNKSVVAKYNNGEKTGKWFFWNGDSLKEVDYSNNVVASVNEWSHKNNVAVQN